MLIGRKIEAKRLKNALNSRRSEFVAVYGRRRVGKTFLIKETLGNRIVFFHSGLAHRDKTAQLAEFAKSLELYGMKSKRRIRNWSDAFFALQLGLASSRAARKVVFLDELPWMDTRKSDFVSALEHFWNGWCFMRNDIVLVICGSATSWIVSKIIKNHGGLHNRLTDQIRLNPFTLAECEKMSAMRGLGYSRQQILDGYMILGGVPYYWERLEKSRSLDQNVDGLFFGDAAPLFDEFEQLYASLFANPGGHLKVVEVLATKKVGMTRGEIVAASRLEDNGALTKVLAELVACGFVRLYRSPGKKVRMTVYQLIDNFTLFYYRFLANGSNASSGRWLARAASHERDVWNGLAFERVCLEHLPQIKKALGISGIDTEAYAWRCRGGEEGAGAQIDLLISRADKAVNICEMKSSSSRYEISSLAHERILNRRKAYIDETKFTGSAFLTLVSPHGAKRNEYWNDFQSEVTLDDLFVEC